MGIPGAGKSRIAEDLVGRGHVRLNRDERGGSLRELADALEEALASGVRRVVLDNTYLTRASRSHVIDAARRHGLPVRCVWLDTPLAQAQVNLVERLLDRAGSLPGPDELRVLARRGDGVLTPTSQMRARRELEPPSDDEGWAVLERAPFARAPRSPAGVAGVFVAAAALDGTRVARRARPRCAAPGLRLAPGRRSRRARSRGSPSSRRRSPARWKARCAPTRADRRAAGAGRRCPGCRWRSRERTASTRPGPSSSASAPPTARSPRRSAPGTSTSGDARLVYCAACGWTSTRRTTPSGCGSCSAPVRSARVRSWRSRARRSARSTAR